MGENYSIHQQLWPVVDKNALVEDTVTIPIQVNGKVRSTLQVRTVEVRDKYKIQEKALKDEKVKKYTEGMKYKVIYVPGKILNFVLF
jgi:leucyl-tRNA synthetase